MEERVETISVGETAKGENANRGEKKVKDRALGNAYFYMMRGGQRAWEGERTDQKNRSRTRDKESNWIEERRELPVEWCEQDWQHRDSNKEDHLGKAGELRVDLALLLKWGW